MKRLNDENFGLQVGEDVYKMMLYGPGLYQGLAILRPYFLQEIMHIMTHIQELVCKSQNGGPLRLIAEALRVELGVPFTLWSTSPFRYGYYIPDCWYNTLWKFIEAHPVEIVEDYPSLSTLRAGDKFLMKCFMESGYSGADIKKLNYVRKYLKAITLSDITTSAGRKLSYESYLCECGNGLRNDFEWPRVPSTLP